MFAMFFLGMGALFFWMVFKASSTQEIMGRGWGFSVRTYERNRQPISYWVTFSSYLVCALLSTIVGVLMAVKALAYSS